MSNNIKSDQQYKCWRNLELPLLKDMYVLNYAEDQLTHVYELYIFCTKFSAVCGIFVQQSRAKLSNIWLTSPFVAVYIHTADLSACVYVCVCVHVCVFVCV